MTRRQRLAIIFFALVAWWPTLRIGFIADDPFLISDSAIHTWDRTAVLTGFFKPSTDQVNPLYYRPLQTLLLRFEFSLFGYHARGYHIVNLGFHALGAILTGEVAANLGWPAPAGFLIASLAAVNPTATHTLLQGTADDSFAYFLFMICYLVLLKPDRRSGVLGIFLFILALAGKETSVILPFLYLLATSMNRQLSRLRSIPLFILLIPYFMFRSMRLGSLATLDFKEIIRFFVLAFPKITAHFAVLYYLPWPLQSWTPIAHLSHAWFLYWTAWLAVGALAWRWMGRSGLFSLGWIFAMLLPKLPAFIDNHVMMDHWIFSSSLGLLSLTVIPALCVWRRAAHRSRNMLLSSFLLLFLVWLFACRFYIYHRGSDELNYRWTLHFGSPDFALYRLGIILIREGKAAEAVPYLDRLCRQSPGQLNYENVLALAYAHTGRTAQARRMWQGLLQRDPTYSPARDNLARL